MKIAYVRRFFPENTETFIIDEIASLKRQGHRVMVYSEKPHLSGMHQKVIDERLLDDVIYCRFAEPTRSTFRDCGKTLLLIISGRWAKSDFRKNHFPHRKLKDEFWNAFHHSLLGTPRLHRPVRLAHALARLVQLSLQIGNVSLAVSQWVAQWAEFKPDVAHCPFTFRWDTLVLAQVLRANPGLPFTVTLRARDLYTTPGDLAFIAFKWDLLSRAHQLITISEYNRAVLRAAFPARPNIPIIHSSIDPSFFSPRGKGLDKSPHSIICVARLVQKKGLPFLIEACAILRDRGLTFTCSIIGQGPLEKSLAQLIAQHRLSQSIGLEGPLNREAIRDRLEKAEIFVLPCILAADGDRDILPNSLKEAMAMALPIVTSNISGIEELIEAKVDGILVPPRSAEALAEEIARLFQDRALREKLGLAARRKIMGDFNIEREGKKFAAILERVTTESPSTSNAAVSI